MLKSIMLKSIMLKSVMLKSIFVAFAFLLGCATISTAAPVEFQLHDMKDGGVYDSNAYLGQPIVIEFYFNGCPACNSNAGNVKALAQKYHGKGAQVVEVSIDEDASDYDYWIRSHSPIGPVLNGSDRVLTGTFGVRAYPTTVVLDKDHKLAWKTVGVWNGATKRKIEQLVGGR